MLNISIASLLDDNAVREAVTYANSRGVVIIAPAGNAGTQTVYYPAGYESVIGVGAVDRAKKLNDKSNRNGSVFLTAPGVQVRSTSAWGGYTDCTGTSYAPPLRCLYLLTEYDVSGRCMGIRVFPLTIPARVQTALAQPDGGRAFCQIIVDETAFTPLICAKKNIPGK